MPVKGHFSPCFLDKNRVGCYSNQRGEKHDIGCLFRDSALKAGAHYFRKQGFAMYKKFYGLKDRPFNPVPDPGYLYLSSYHRDALAYLTAEAEKNSNPIIFTGDIGTGKTVLLRTFLKTLGPEVNLVQIFYSGNDRVRLLQMILLEMGIDSGQTDVDSLRSEIKEHLGNLLREGREVFLVIDEAQDLDEDALDEACLLSRLEVDGRHLVRVILAGLPKLQENIDSLSNLDCRDNITKPYYLKKLSDEDIPKYIHHRLATAGCTDVTVFPEDVLSEISHFSRGIPRLINMICDAVLLYGYFSEKKVVTMSLFKEVIADLFNNGNAEDGYQYETAAVASGIVGADQDTRSGEEPGDIHSGEKDLEGNGKPRTEEMPVQDVDSRQGRPLPMTVLVLEKNARMRVRLEDKYREAGINTVVLSTLEGLFKTLESSSDLGLHVLVADSSFFFAKGGSEDSAGKDALDRIQRDYAHMPLIVTATLPLTVIRTKLFQRGIPLLLHKPDLNRIDLSEVQTQFDSFFNELQICLSNIHSQFGAIYQKTIKWLTDSQGVIAASERRAKGSSRSNSGGNINEE
ncbi:MAG: AAA family ATPase [Nitrospirota bacterium]|nr:AAA family ATPase [Nitrospirota bacterium]